jgi:precorrin-6A/cobalt-precorrin-6A reductase
MIHAKTVLVMGGTTEGREIAHLLQEAGFKVFLSSVSEYGAQLAKGGQEQPADNTAQPRPFSGSASFALSAGQSTINFPGQGTMDFPGLRSTDPELPLESSGLVDTLGGPTLLVGRRNQEELATLLRQQGIALLIDATHPFAQEASRNARAAATITGIPYIRFERPSTDLSTDFMMAEGASIIHTVADYDEAAAKAAALGDVIFLAIGSKNLAPFRQAVGQAVGEALAKRQKRLIARVLPDPTVIKKCLDLGFWPADIVAMQGPFSRELNRALLEHFHAQVLVTKESGPTGGTPEKIQAAHDLGLPVVLIKRPQLDYGLVVRDYAALFFHVRQLFAVPGKSERKGEGQK